VVDDHLFGGLAAAFIVYIGYQLLRHRSVAHLEWRGAWWLAPYFAGLWLLTFLGPPNLSHGIGAISGWTASLLIVALSLCIIQLAKFCAIADPGLAKARYHADNMTNRT
jgi:hypothetical protein